MTAETIRDPETRTRIATVEFPAYGRSVGEVLERIEAAAPVIADGRPYELRGPAYVFASEHSPAGDVIVWKGSASMDLFAEDEAPA